MLELWPLLQIRMLQVCHAVAIIGVVQGVGVDPLESMLRRDEQDPLAAIDLQAHHGDQSFFTCRQAARIAVLGTVAHRQCSCWCEQHRGGELCQVLCTLL